jgi:hypothetical protein
MDILFKFSVEGDFDWYGLNWFMLIDKDLN